MIQYLIPSFLLLLAAIGFLIYSFRSIQKGKIRIFLYYLTIGQRKLLSELGGAEGNKLLESTGYREVYKNESPKTYWFLTYGHLFLSLLFFSVSVIIILSFCNIDVLSAIILVIHK